jgi:hypothetical protein
VDTFLNWLASGSTPAIIIVVVVSIVCITAVLIYVLAFFQGRTISFYPPQIGERPSPAQKEKKAVKTGQNHSDIEEACEQLGIRGIFSQRDIYQVKYPLQETVKSAFPDSTFRIVARTMYLLVNRSEDIKQALIRGAKVELCCYDPDADPSILEQLAFYTRMDTIAALLVFRRHFVMWLQETLPVGTLEIRYHKIPLLESYFSFAQNGEVLCTWDLSFGRDITEKHIFLLEDKHGLGANLSKRYNQIWGSSITQFKYANKLIEVNNLPKEENKQSKHSGTVKK